jgi:hypothetical protein
MTERWRKRLGKLDDVSPSDDVLQRAKAGPQLPEEMVPRPKATTRVATAIAAFVVFALAISVFAIPALRMRDDAAGTGVSGVQPLWPWRTTDEVRGFDANPQPIGDLAGTAAYQPDAVASAFGRQILGWDGPVYTHESGVPQTYPCDSLYAGSPSQAPPFGSAPPQCLIVYPQAASHVPSIVTWVPTTAPPALRSFDLSTCEPNAICDYSFPGPGNASVVMYQPLGADGPWAVLEAQSQYLDLSVSPGDVIRKGSTASVSAQIPTGSASVLGLHVGSDACVFTQGTTGFRGPGSNDRYGLGSFGAQLDAALSPPEGSCPSTDHGYVFAAIAANSDESLINGRQIVDPLTTGGPRLFAFAAVPVTAVLPPADEGSTESPTQVAVPPTSPTPDGGSTVAVALGTYTDQLGWTIDVPETWRRDVVDGVFDGRTTSTGAWFSSGAPQVLPGIVNFPGNPVPADDAVMIKIWHRDGGPAPTYEDDSPFPLSPDDLQPEDVAGKQQMTFRGDGLEFQLEVEYGQNADIGALRPLVDHMIGSIAFRPWQVGDTRNGFTALETPKASTQWVPFGDTSKRVILVQTATGYVALGPVTCDENGMTATSWDPSTTCPDSLPLATWDTSGQPDPNNAPGFQHPLPVHPVILSWGGVLLSTLDVTIG